jgi:excisionase family DNA binding protein
MSDDIKILVARLREAEVNVEVLQWQVKADKTRAYPIVQQEEERVVAKEKDEKRKYKKHIWLTNDEAAQLLKMPKSTFSQWTSSGRIPSRLRRGKMLYDKEVLEKFSVADIRQRMYEKRPSSRGNTDNKK